jgi:integrase
MDTLDCRVCVSESEIDVLINRCGKKMSCFLQGLKDTGADPSELGRLEWTDVNFEAKSVTLKHIC